MRKTALAAGMRLRQGVFGDGSRAMPAGLKPSFAG